MILSLNICMKYSNYVINISKYHLRVWLDLLAVNLIKIFRILILGISRKYLGVTKNILY